MLDQLTTCPDTVNAAPAPTLKNACPFTNSITKSFLGDRLRLLTVLSVVTVSSSAVNAVVAIATRLTTWAVVMRTSVPAWTAGISSVPLRLVAAGRLGMVRMAT